MGKSHLGCHRIQSGRLIVEMSSIKVEDATLVRRTKVDAQLLKVWRSAAFDLDDQVEIWLSKGGPAGITTHLLDPGIFPACATLADLQPQDLHCDQQEFRNYPGVEEQQITDRELQLH